MRLFASVLLCAPALMISAPAWASSWVVEPAHSVITFEGTESGRPFTGRFAGFEARIVFDPADLAGARVEVTIPLAGMTAGSPMRDDELGKPEWFDFTRFPSARFTAATFTASGPSQYTASGELTIRDVALPLQFPFTLEISGDSARVRGEVTLDRTAFGIGQGQWASDETVGRTVRVMVDLTATRAP